MTESLKDNYLGGLRKDSKLCSESLFFYSCQKVKNRLRVKPLLTHFQPKILLLKPLILFCVILEKIISYTLAH